MKPLSSIFGFLFLLILGLQATAQSFTASLSQKKVGVNQRFVLRYSLQNLNMEGLNLPDLPNFRLVSGPNTSSSVMMVNNSYQSTTTVEYEMICGTAGTHPIGPATLKSGGKTYKSNALEITVDPKMQPGAQQQAQPRQDPFNPFGGGGQQQPQQEVKLGKNDLFIVTSLSKSSVYPGEAVTVTYKIYTRFPQVNIEDIKFPEYRDAWINELKESGDKSFSREAYNGQNYNMAVLQKTLFIPQRTGDFSIKPVTATVVVQFTQRSGNFWEDFFNGGRVRQERMDVTGNPVTLKVKEYPEAGKPDSFDGATGNFTMEVSTDKPAVAVNDAITLKVKISGTGNLGLMSAPKPDSPDAFEIFDPKSTDKISAKPGGTTGSKTFDYLLIPRAPGKYKIPPVQFSYFDPEAKKYNTLVSDSIPVTVTGDASGGAVVDASGRRSENLAEDIRYIKTDFDPSDKLSGFFPGILFVVLYILLMAVTVAFWFARTKIWDLRNDTDRKKIRVADAVAVKRLKKAADYLQQGKRADFYEECYRSVIQYLQDRMGLQLSSISAGKVKAFLLEKNVSENLASEAGHIIDACELARFAPPGSATELNDFHTRCIRFISNMENR